MIKAIANVCLQPNAAAKKNTNSFMLDLDISKTTNATPVPASQQRALVERLMKRVRRRLQSGNAPQVLHLRPAVGGGVSGAGAVPCAHARRRSALKRSSASTPKSASAIGLRTIPT